MKDFRQKKNCTEIFTSRIYVPNLRSCSLRKVGKTLVTENSEVILKCTFVHNRIIFQSVRIEYENKMTKIVRVFTLKSIQPIQYI